MDRRAPFLLAAMLLASAAASRADEPDAAGIEFFETKIRPVLVNHCYECHSGAAKELKGELQLDSRAGVLQGGESGVAVVPGNVEASLLIQALRYEEGEMPPDGKLPAEIIADFEQWVRLGLPDPRDGKELASTKLIDFVEARKFWAFQPIAKVEPPAVKATEWLNNDIDRFVLAKLEAADLAPSPPADRASLLRRASFDLIGLPPTPEEVAAFLNDKSPAAFEKVVDRLLASPHYGERWGRHWLDVARFGEDQAHTFQARMYPSAFRYRDWVVDALNNDLPYDQFLIAQIAGDLLEEPSDNDAIKKQRAAALGFFALGPIYYADNNAAKQAQADEWDDRVDTLTRGMLGLTVACARCHDHKFDPITTRDYYALAGIFASTKYVEFPLASTDEQAQKRAADDDVKAQQKEIDDFLDVESKALRRALAHQIAPYLVGVWKHENRRKQNSKFSTGESATKDNLNEALLRRWRDYLNGRGKEQPALAGWREVISKQDSAADLSTDEVSLTETSAAAEAFQQQVLSLLEATATAADGERAQQAVQLLEQLVGDQGVLALPRGDSESFLSEEQQQELKPRRDELARRKQVAEAIHLPIAHSLAEGSPVDLKILVQGNPNKTGDTASRGYLTVLSAEAPVAIPASASGRLEIARAIAGPQNPLTARVAVNRVWQGHFGQGLVRTPSNFGALGERPTHPELLDYLTKLFIESGWSLKTLHRQIMLSAAYRQTSQANTARDERDPENRLLSHMSRRRLEVEPWRDAMLAASGTLDLTLGGPSANLAQTEFRRRTLYGYVSRHQLNELLRLFDFPDPNITSDRRSTTTVPLQQLFVLNSDFLTRQAKALAARVERESATANSPDSEEDRIRRVYALVFGRVPTERELTLGQAFLSTTPTGALSAWEEYALALLGSNEFAFVD